MFLKLIQSPIFWLLLLVLGFGYYTYNLYNENQNLKYEKEIVKQNSQSVSDSLTKMKDSVQTITSKIGDLNSKIDYANKTIDLQKHQYRALYIKYEMAIAKIETVYKNPAICSDSTVKHSFNGKKGIASYNVNSVIDIKTCQSTDSIKINFDDINSSSELIYEDSLWKIRTTSLTEGIIIRGLSTIDNETFKKLKGPASENSKIKYFGIGGILNEKFIAPGILIKYTDWIIGANYIFGNDNLQTHQRLIFTTYYFPF